MGIEIGEVTRHMMVGETSKFEKAGVPREVRPGGNDMDEDGDNI